MGIPHEANVQIRFKSWKQRDRSPDLPHFLSCILKVFLNFAYNAVRAQGVRTTPSKGYFTMADLVAARATVRDRYDGALTTQVMIPTDCVDDFLQGEGRQFRTSFNGKAHPATKALNHSRRMCILLPDPARTPLTFPFPHPSDTTYHVKRKTGLQSSTSHVLVALTSL